ncbi:potassium channel family protein [Actinocorallia sp. API 0066]|uniref:potassium channel family protein n=1 Tax=Actinocorallia sp. API 0066 TaxID=2896846 RepID=UPI001E4FAFB6|nr:potassium channel family protein [Actinocorallia sp. API 0066]MCD0448814.1 potassium channel family protein [Actinocorallia sp. API 0066]
MGEDRTPLRRLVVWGEALAAFVGGAVVFFAIPVRQSDVSSGYAARGVLLFLSLSVVTAILLRQARRVAHGRRPAAEQIALLLSIVDLVVVFFALLYYARAHEFTGLTTRLDALYFSVSTLCTVGYGDIVPVATWAKVLTTVQMVFDLVIVTSVLTLVLSRRPPAPPASRDVPSR